MTIEDFLLAGVERCQSYPQFQKKSVFKKHSFLCPQKFGYCMPFFVAKAVLVNFRNRFPHTNSSAKIYSYPFLVTISAHFISFFA